MTSAGTWTTKATDQFTLEQSMAEATTACMGAAESTKAWRVKETESERVLVHKQGTALAPRSFHVEVLLTDAGGERTDVTLNGWTFGKGPGMTKMVKTVIGEFRAAIEAPPLPA